MRQLYSKKQSFHKEMQPKKETIEFLLGYSKQVCFKKDNTSKSFEFNLN